MKSGKIGTMVLIGSALLFQGCAHGTVDKQLDAKLSQENNVKDRADLQTETNQLIETAPGLSADQKSKLVALRDSTRSRADAIRDQSLKLRSILIKDLISSNYDEEEVELVKRRIKALEDQRLSAMFGAVEKANTILGREAAANRRIVHDFMFEQLGEGERSR